MHIEQLVKMANDIGNFFNSEPDRATAIAGIADHLQKFWEPRMRQQIIAYQQEGGPGLQSSVREAVKKLV